VRVQRIKTFDERYTAAIRGRINAIKPGYYTRMGAAIRYATGLLNRQCAARRLLLLLTDANRTIWIITRDDTGLKIPAWRCWKRGEGSASVLRDD
jgi:hypothetical protein